MCKRNPADLAAYLREHAQRCRKLAIEFEEQASRYDSRDDVPGTPEDGHTWRIYIESRSSGKVVGEGSHRDLGSFSPLHNPVAIRAWSLSEALIAAAGLPLDAWFNEEDD